MIHRNVCTIVYFRLNNNKKNGSTIPCFILFSFFLSEMLEKEARVIVYTNKLRKRLLSDDEGCGQGTAAEALASDR